MDGSVEQDDVPTSKNHKVSGNLTETVIDEAEKSKIVADPTDNPDNEAVPSVRDFKPSVSFGSTFTIRSYF